MACQNETVTYPSWWDAATGVKVTSSNNGSTAVEYLDTIEGVELLPEGVSIPSPAKLIPWSYVLSVEKTS